MRIGFRTKFYIGLFSMLLLLGVITCIVVTRVMQTALLEENRKLGLAIGTSLAAQAVEPTLAMDFLLLRSLMIDTLRLEKEIRYAFIQDAGGAPLAHSFEGGFPSALKTANAVAADQPFQIRFLNTGAELVYDFAIPILAGEERLGTLRLGLTHNRVRQAVGHLVWVLVMSTGFVLLVAGFVGAGLLRHVTWRIERLHRSTEEALRGNLEVHAAPPLKKNCWEIMACANQDCPAYQDVYHRCWYLAGTLCPYCAAGDYAQKIGDCAQCPVYRRCAGDEIQTLAESFDSMVLSLRTHLSDLRDAEKTLKDQRQLLRTVLDGIPDFITLQDRHASYRAVNKAFGRILGRNVAEIVGKTNFDLLPRRMAEKFQAEDQAIYATGKSLVKETRTRTPSGERWFHVVKLPIYDADGHHAGFLCTGHDITDLKRIQEQLYQAQKMEAIGRLVAGIAHEINTPLGIALGFVQVLREEEAADSQIGRDLETVEKQIQVCKKIVADLLKFSRQSDTRHLPLDINETIEEVLAVVAHTLEINRVKLKRLRRHRQRRHHHHRQPLGSRFPGGHRHGDGHRSGDPPREKGPYFRTVFHHQAGGQRDRPGAFAELQHRGGTRRPAEPREPRRRTGGRGRRHICHPAAGGPGRTRCPGARRARQPARRAGASARLRPRHGRCPGSYPPKNIPPREGDEHGDNPGLGRRTRCRRTHPAHP
jgi:PAS domain S-box-containing protein